MQNCADVPVLKLLESEIVICILVLVEMWSDQESSRTTGISKSSRISCKSHTRQPQHLQTISIKHLNFDSAL